MAIQVQRVTEEDCKDVSSFLAHALPDSWRSAALPDEPQIQRIVSSGASIALLARQEGMVVGLAVGWCFPNVVGLGDTAMLDELLVDPANRGSGIGTALVGAFINTARQQGKAPVEVWATTDFPGEPAATPFAEAGGKQGCLLRQFDWPREACA